jgi:threonine/homoserine/homoserine lactone efflux protein
LIHALAGLVAGTVHVLSGPDHLTAVAPLAVSSRRPGWRAGALWGAGHTAGVWMVGALSLVFREVLPIERLSAWSERIVGVVLIVIGLWALRRALAGRVHTHRHRHDGGEHAHIHVHKHAAAPRSERHVRAAHEHTHAALGVGLLHGLAGSSHFLGVLPALALPSTGAAAWYLGAYGAGTVVAMACFTGVVGFLGHRAAGRAVPAYRALLATSALAAIGVGCFWLIG